MEQARHRSKKPDHEVSLESRSGTLLRLQLYDEANVGLQIRQHVLSAVGGLGYTGAGPGSRKESESVRAAGWATDEHGRERCAVGSALRLGKYRDAGDRWTATLQRQRRCRPSVVQLSVDGGREFPPRQRDPREVQRRDTIFRGARRTRLSHERGRLRLD